ncbi:MAG TPA: MarR family transcriptional regulator [Gaiellaceae bacterium]|nr:MarR family transcriptional regulator [Gaiellaceae bacterium]
MTVATAEPEQPQPGDEVGEPRISYVVARLERAIRRAINERVSVYDLTVLQYTTLSVLGRRGELSNAQLARRAYMSPQAMSEVIEALERKGLIKRSQHPNHRRVYPAGLTAKGRKVLAACDRLVDAMEGEMLEGLSPAEQQDFRKGLVTAVRALHAGLPEH